MKFCKKKGKIFGIFFHLYMPLSVWPIAQPIRRNWRRNWGEISAQIWCKIP